jgi:hypothetical protein
VSADCSPQWSIENEIRTIPGLGSFTAYTVGMGLLGFSRCKWINSHPPAVCHHFGGRALLHRRHANRLEIERPPFINAGTAFRGAWLTSAVVISGSSAPVTPPTAPPTPSPARPAMIGPAAMNGPRLGIANSPTPASSPSVPPITPPVVLQLNHEHFPSWFA